MTVAAQITPSTENGAIADSAVVPAGAESAQENCGAAEEISRSVSTTTSSADEDEHLNTDDRPRFDWRGHYSAEANKEIWFEARIVGAILAITFALLFLTWRGVAFEFLAGECADCSRNSFDRYAYFYLGGQLGGILFGVKYLYKVVARGYWNIDRRLWRFFSPFLSGGLALVIGALTDSGVLGLSTNASSGSAYFSLGFIAGYFADSALAKMQEIADTIFGSPSKRNAAPANSVGQAGARK